MSPAGSQPPQDVPPFLFVIIGATGDLTRRKLLPALHALVRGRHIEGDYQVLGVARSAMADGEFRDWARDALEEAHVEADGEAAEGEDPLADWCDHCLHYVSVDGGGEEDYRRVREKIEEIEADAGLPGNRVFYLALPPAAFAPTIRGLGQAGLHEPPDDTTWARLVVEKPFGHDLASAQELNTLVHRWFDESQVYRIDHYLGKETVQNLLVFRFANTVFEALWNRQYVDSVQITVAESIGVGSRAGYYDSAGALRDMVQNHVTQVLSLVAMEVPVAYGADAVRGEKIKALRSVRPIDPAQQVVLGQYAAGRVDGEPVAAYRDADGVEDDSDTETFAALRLFLDSWRWQGVPFLLRTGKRLERRVTEVAVVFQCPPVALFESLGCGDLEANVLRITLQPDEGVSLDFQIKTPGEPLELRGQELDFEYEDVFGPLPSAYETLLLDVVTGDQTLFVHGDEVEVAWELYAPVLEADGDTLPAHPYEAGSWGPEEADRLLEPGEHWRTR